MLKQSFVNGEKGISKPTDEQLFEGFQFLCLKALKMKFTKDYFTIPKISSQYNEIINFKLSSKPTTNTQTMADIEASAERFRQKLNA